MILNKNLKYIIVFILLIIFCFVLCIFDVKASSVDYVLNPDTLQYTYDDSGATSHYENISSLNMKDMHIYDLTFFTTTDEYVSNNSSQLYWRIKADIANSYGRLPYLVYVVYSPFKLYYPQPCLYYDSGNTVCSPTNHYEVVETKLNTEEDNYFYIVRTMDTGSNNNFISAYALEWSYSPSLSVVTNSNSYFISQLYVTATEQDAIDLVTNYEDYFNNYAPDDPELPDNPLSDILKPDVDTDDWTVVIGGWNNDFNPSSNNPISNLAQLPIIFLTSVNNAISGTCTPVNYIELYNYQVVLPCLNLSTRLGVVWTIIDTIFSCMLIYSIGKSLVLTFARLSDMDTNIMYECYSEGMQRRGRDLND